MPPGSAPGATRWPEMGTLYSKVHIASQLATGTHLQHHARRDTTPSLIVPSLGKIFQIRGSVRLQRLTVIVRAFEYAISKRHRSMHVLAPLARLLHER